MFKLFVVGNTKSKNQNAAWEPLLPPKQRPPQPPAMAHGLHSPLNLAFASLQTSIASLFFFACLIFNRHV